MPWTISKKLNSIHILSGDPPKPKHKRQGGRRDWESATATDFLDARVTTLVWYRDNGPSKEDQEANARLIAAAPETARERDELLAALIDLTNETSEGLEPDHIPEALVRAREAINKTKGGAK